MNKVAIGIGAYVLSLVSCFAAPEVRNVTAKQRYPWNGKVDITFEVIGNVVSGLPDWNNPVLSLLATECRTGLRYESKPDAVYGDIGTSEGVHHIVWDLNAQEISFKSDNVVFTVAYITHPMYCVIDLSAGSGAVSYPVAYMDLPPVGGFNMEEYKTTKLVLRLIEPGTFKMCNSYDVTLTKPFYCGIFEVTQKQYELVTGANPSHFNNVSCYAARPVEVVSYNQIRGLSSGVGWPDSVAVDANSFMGKIRAKTQNNGFDLPTEAQWEYACRAGTTTDYNSGENCTGVQCANMDEVGRYLYNGGSKSPSQSCGTEEGTATVGSYRPNAWGLYDMHGNVDEMCLDWYGSLSRGVTNPVGPSSGTYRVLRGGGFQRNAGNCTSLARFNIVPSNGSYHHGFRLVGNLLE